ncbi:MAG: hypothetical protein JRN21_05080 [Nitrososphaerota archaeon]|nr:hypothetical protein [Nitrososphaerota archaeon]
MKVGNGNAARALLAAVLLGLVCFVLLVQYAPDSVAFSPNNYGWNGLQGVASAYKVRFTTSLSTVPQKSVLVVAQPSIDFSASEAGKVKGFLLGGGTVLVADNSGVANSLLAEIGSAISIEEQHTISDQTYNWKSSSVPTALVLPGVKPRFGFLANVTGIALDTPSPLLVSGGATGLAITSQFSGYSTPKGTVRGPFVVMAEQKFGSGTLIVIGDSQVLLNSEWTVADNKVLIGNLFANAPVYIDASHWGVSSTAQVKAELAQFYGSVSGSPSRYIATLFMVGLALALVPAKGTGPTPINERRRGVSD